MNDMILVKRELLERLEQWVESDCSALDELQAILAAPAQGDWIPVSERLPGGIVLAHYRNHYGTSRTIRAQYVKPFTEEANYDADSDCYDYSEADDCYYVKEGWYELIDNWGDYSSVAVVEGEITHWMPLPPPPKEQSHD
jgi:hypothetical protein